jgi:hypothetical protein
MLLVAGLRRRWPLLFLGAGALVTLAGASLRWHHVVLWFTWFVAAFTVGRWTLVRGLDARALAGAAVLFVLFLALRQVPAQLHSLNESYRTGSRYASFRQSERGAQTFWGVDAGFISYVSRHLPRGDPFVVSPPVTDDAPQRWLQFELLPSIEETSPCSARWVVFYGSDTVPDGVRLGKVLVFKPGYALARVASCTS